MARLPHHGLVTTAGIVVAKQQPPTAQGFAFYVVEDGPLRLIVILPTLWETERTALREAGVLIVTGWLEKRGRAWTVRAEQLADAGTAHAKLETGSATSAEV